MNPPGNRRLPLALLGILGIALGVRLWGIAFGLPHVRVRPDELFILGAVIKMHGGDPNPGFFDYPALYMYLVAGLYAIYYGIGVVAGWFADSAAFVEHFYNHWTPFFLIPRVLGAVLGAATAGIVYAIAAALLDRRSALLSAFFLSLAFLHVRDSHYATTDVTMTFFIACAVLGAVRVHQGRRAQDAWLAGALAGCATSTKYNAVVVVLVLAVVELLHAWDHRSDWRRALRETHIFRMAAACIFVFAITNPYLVLDHETALRDLQLLQASTAGGMTPPEMLGRGWTYHLPNSLRHGVGMPLLVAALLGIPWMLIRAPRAGLMLAVFPLAYYAATGAGYNVFVRYMVPVVPFVCLFAGFVAARVAAALPRLSTRLREPVAAGVVGLALVGPSARSVVQFDALLAEDDNRLVGARWVHEHVPAGSSIYTAGNLYGHLQLETRGTPPKYRYFDFDWNAERFTVNRRPSTERPDWIIVQRSGILYSHLSPAVERIIEQEYALVATLRAADLSQRNFYDVQDGFYAPFGGFEGVRRFGPNYEIYRRRE